MLALRLLHIRQCFLDTREAECGGAASILSTMEGPQNRCPPQRRVPGEWPDLKVNGVKVIFWRGEGEGEGEEEKGKGVGRGEQGLVLTDKHWRS